jgi:hypothetical protein
VARDVDRDPRPVHRDPGHERLHGTGGACSSSACCRSEWSLGAAAVAGVVGRPLPSRLAGAAVVVGGIAPMNGTMLGAESAWGPLLATVWVRAAGITLAARRPIPITIPEPSAAAT